MRTQIEILVIVIMLCAGAVVAQWDGWGGSPVRRPAPASGAVVDGHWVDPYSTNEIGYLFFADGQSSTNINSSYGSIGSMADNAATNFGVAVHNVVSNRASVAAGPLQGGGFQGTNNQGDLISPWLLDGVTQFFLICNSNRFAFGNGLGEDKPFTVGAWGYLTNKGAGYPVYIIAKGYEWRFFFYDNKVYCDVHSNNNSGVANEIRAGIAQQSWSNVWVFYAATYDGSMSANGLTLYTNGVAMTNPVRVTQYSTVGMTNTTMRANVGNQGGTVASSSWKGWLAFPFITSNCWTAAEIATFYTNTGGAFGPTNSIRKKFPTDAYP